MYLVEMTDTYGGEANYAWVRRFSVKAKTHLGAMRKVAKETGYNFHKAYGDPDMTRYDANKACICFFVNETDADLHELYAGVKDL